MKKLVNYCFILAALLLGVGCTQEETMDYEGKDGLYFDVQYGAEHGNENVWAHQFYSYVGFGGLDSATYVLPIRIKVVGRVVDYDRPFQVEIVADSTTAEEGVEFEFVKDLVIKAGEMQTDLVCTLNRTDRMKDSTFQIQFRLVGGEYFELPFSEIGNIPGRWTDSQTAYSSNIDPGIHNVFVDNFLSRPLGWGVEETTLPTAVILGKYTPTKYQLLLDITGLPQADFNDQKKMNAGLRAYACRVLSAYLMEQYKKGRDYWVLDEDGTMMYTFGVTWGPNTNPDDMVDPV